MSSRADIFFSLRFNASGPLKEAHDLQSQLASRGINAVIVNVESGRNIEDDVIYKLDQCKLAVLFGTADYGVKGSNKFSTQEELSFIMEENKPFFLIKMCDRFTDAKTRFRLPGAVSYVDWRVGQPMPPGLVDKIIARYVSEGGVVPVSVDTSSSSSSSSSSSTAPSAAPSFVPTPAPVSDSVTVASSSSNISERRRSPPTAPSFDTSSTTATVSTELNLSQTRQPDSNPTPALSLIIPPPDLREYEYVRSTVKPAPPPRTDIKLRDYAQYGKLQELRSLISSYDVSSIVDNDGINGRAALYLACNSGHLECVRALLECGANVNAKTGDGAEPSNIGAPVIYGASINGHTKIVKLLLDYGANVNDTSRKGASALYVACDRGHAEVVKLLLERGASVNVAVNGELTPLKRAQENKHAAVVALLEEALSTISTTTSAAAGSNISYAFDPSSSTEPRSEPPAGSDKKLRDYAQNGKLKELLAMISKYDISSIVETLTSSGRTPLYLATRAGHIECVKALLDNGADINAKTGTGAEASNIGASILHAASGMGHVDIVNLLLDRGASINAVNFNGVSVFYVACERGHKAVVKVLMDRGVLVNAANKNGASPLYIACENGHRDVAKMLLSFGANVNAAKTNGATSLYIACQNNFVDIVKLLLEYSANVNFACNGISPLAKAEKKGFLDIVELLKASGAKHVEYETL